MEYFLNIFLILFILYFCVNHKLFFSCLVNENIENQKKVLLCGLLREPYPHCDPIILERLVDGIGYKILDLYKYFSHVKCIIVCDDDRCLPLIKKLPYDVHVIITDPKHQTTHHELGAVHEYDSNRIQKMANLRNLYIDYIKAQHLDEEFFTSIVMDFDLQGEVIGWNRALRYLENDDVDAVSANGTIRHYYANNTLRYWAYYDTLAFTTKKGSKVTPKMMSHLLGFPLTFPLSAFTIHPYQVSSAFGGCTMYKTKSLIAQNSYAALDSIHQRFSRGKFKDSEHTRIHANMRIFVHPLFQFKIKTNF
jgi:hypothetical protein